MLKEDRSLCHLHKKPYWTLGNVDEINLFFKVRSMSVFMIVNSLSNHIQLIHWYFLYPQVEGKDFSVWIWNTIEEICTDTLKYIKCMTWMPYMNIPTLCWWPFLSFVIFLPHGHSHTRRVKEEKLHSWSFNFLSFFLWRKYYFCLFSN